MAILRIIVVVLLLAAASNRAHSCSWPPPSLRDLAAMSEFVAVVRIEVPKDGDTPPTTCLSIKEVLKGAGGVGNRTVLRVPCAVPAKKLPNPPVFVVFGTMHVDAPDVIRAVPASPAVIEYVRGLTSDVRKGNAEVLSYCFDYLGSADPVVAEDAYLAFACAANADVARAARKLDAAKLRRWLADKELAPGKMALYGYLLGHCGNKGDTELLRRLIDDPENQVSDLALEKLLVGCTLLDSTEGLATLGKWAEDPESRFLIRYAVIRTVRFFRAERPGVIADKDLYGVLGMLLDHHDVADFAIEELRKCRCWDNTDRVLAAPKKKGVHPMLTRAVLHYALQCPDERCKDYVAKERQKCSKQVEDAEELLRLLDLKEGPDPKLN
jgi:hypothetical protein